jgi:hypothetical protein
MKEFKPFIKIPNKKYQDAIIWLLVDMQINKTYYLDKIQRQIIIEIFVTSGIFLCTKPQFREEYWYNIGKNWNNITKFVNNQAHIDPKRDDLSTKNDVFLPEKQLKLL